MPPIPHHHPLRVQADPECTGSPFIPRDTLDVRFEMCPKQILAAPLRRTVEETRTRSSASKVLADQPANQMAKVLHVGRNEAVIATRQAMLERAGHEFVSAHDIREVLAACKGVTFDVLVLGQLLPAMEKKRIRHTMLEHCPDAKVIECHVSFTPDIPDADAHIQVGTSGPESLITAVKRLTERSNSQTV